MKHDHYFLAWLRNLQFLLSSNTCFLIFPDFHYSLWTLCITLDSQRAPTWKILICFSPHSYGARQIFLNYLQKYSSKWKIEESKIYSPCNFLDCIFENFFENKNHIPIGWKINFILFNFSFGAIFSEIIEKNVSRSIRLTGYRNPGQYPQRHTLFTSWLERSICSKLKYLEK